MSSQSQKASWNDDEVTALLNHLFEHKTGTDGVGNFKEPVWNSAIPKIAPLLTNGPPKNVKMCQNKWTGVECFFYHHLRHFSSNFFYS